MSVYQSLVDPTNFGTVVRHLHHPDRQIHFVLHVRDESMLPVLAAKLDAAMAEAQHQPIALGSILDPMFAEGSLRISPRHELPMNRRWPVVPVTQIPSLAGCRVLYLPPFYLAHTPGPLRRHPRQTPAPRAPQPQPPHQTLILAPTSGPRASVNLTPPVLTLLSPTRCIHLP